MTETEVTDKLLEIYTEFERQEGSPTVYKSLYKLLNSIRNIDSNCIIINGSAIDFIDFSVEDPELFKLVYEKYNNQHIEQTINIYYKEIQNYGNVTVKTIKQLAQIHFYVEFDELTGKSKIRESITYGIQWYVLKYIEYSDGNDTIDYRQIGSYLIAGDSGILYRSIVKKTDEYGNDYLALER